ncbi:MAG: hypothetical protein ACREHV_06565 [Rhizomicrobium sp.]
MTWTYSANPEASLADAVRLLCGDTDPADPLLQDSEIAYIIAVETNPWFAAASAAQAIASHYARRVDRTVGKLSIKGTDLVTQYQKLAYDLRRRGAVDGLIPINLAESIAAKQSQELDTDRVEPFFRRHLQDYPGTGTLDSEEEFYQAYEEPG